MGDNETPPAPAPVVDARAFAEEIVNRMKPPTPAGAEWDDPEKYWLVPPDIDPKEHGKRLHDNITKYVKHLVSEQVTPITKKVDQHEIGLNYFDIAKADSEDFSKNKEAAKKIMDEEGVSYKAALRILKAESKPTVSKPTPVPPPSASTPSTTTDASPGRSRQKVRIRDVINQAKKEGHYNF
jgi:hypothetical protein